VDLAAGKFPDQPAVDGAEQQLAVARALAAAFDVVEDPLELGAGEVGSVTRPVVSLMYCSWPSRLSCWQISVLRRHCQTIAL
jgi:hypothetical protein